MSITKGKWTRRADMICGNERKVEGGTQSDVVCRLGSDFGLYPNADENGRLICAAPDLLSAMKELFEQCAMIHKYGGTACNAIEADAAIAAAREAIRKAGG